MRRSTSKGQRMSDYTTAEFEELEVIVYDFFKQHGENWADYDLTYYLMQRAAISGGVTMYRIAKETGLTETAIRKIRDK